MSQFEKIYFPGLTRDPGANRRTMLNYAPGPRLRTKPLIRLCWSGERLYSNEDTTRNLHHRIQKGTRINSGPLNFITFSSGNYAALTSARNVLTLSLNCCPCLERPSTETKSSSDAVAFWAAASDTLPILSVIRLVPWAAS